MIRVLLAALCLAACAPAALSDFNPIDTDPAGLTVASRLDPSPAGTPTATMTLGARHPDGRALRETFDLAEVPKPADAPAGATLFFRLKDGDRQRMTRARARIAEWKSEAPATRGQFSVALDLESPTRSTVWISPAPGEPYSLILREASLP